jgi:hypothetical protein
VVPVQKTHAGKLGGLGDVRKHPERRMVRILGAVKRLIYLWNANRQRRG